MSFDPPISASATKPLADLNSQPEEKPVAKPMVQPVLRRTDDVDTLRDSVYGAVERAAGSLAPHVGQNHTLQLVDVGYAADPGFGRKAEKQAILNKKSLSRRLQGTWQLLDNTSGQVLDEKRATVANVPAILHDGSFIRRGTRYMTGYQQRLRPGIYTRRRASGEVSSQANIKQGFGASHHYVLEPESGLFHVNIGHAKIPLVPLLEILGTSRDDMRAAWGDDIADRNFKKIDARSVGKLYQRFVPKRLRETGDERDQGKMKNKVREAFNNMMVDSEVVDRTLGIKKDVIDGETILKATQEILSLSRGDREADDRDHLAYATFHGAPDIFSERISKDYGRVQRNLLHKLSRKGSTQGVPSSALDKQIEAAIFNSGLAQAVEDVNPLESKALMTRVTRFGEGGLSSTTAAPDESRNLSMGQFGFIDMITTPESSKVGVDGFLAQNTFVGDDNKLYTKLLDNQGREVVKNAADVLDSKLSLGRSPIKGYDGAIVNGKLTRIPSGTADYYLPHPEELFGHATKLAPMKSAQAGNRSSMAARMATQALSVENPEAPLVQAGVPGTEYDSYEAQMGEDFGAVRAKEPGRVISVEPDEIKIKHRGGKVSTIELDNNRPSMRKSWFHQTPKVALGQEVQPGQLLATSNFTDENGVAALGKNLRTALVAGEGAWEDAIRMSQSAANRMRLQTAQQHYLENDTGLKLGRTDYLTSFGNKLETRQLEQMDESGVVKPGTVVKKGDPLILAVRNRVGSKSKIHSSGKTNFSDASVKWDHAHSGVVTDVAKTNKGVNVVVKNVRPMEEGDKLSGRYGNKGVVTIVPDEQMPVDSEGNPFELVISPQSVPSRGNASFKTELLLSRVAKKRGRPYRVEDMKDRDLREWAISEAKKHDVPVGEEIYDPVTNQKIKHAGAGYLFSMALHHLSENKASSRGLGSYSSEGEPAKGPGENAQSKRASGQQLWAEMSHGAFDLSKEHTLLRGQKNDDYWAAFMSGHQVASPRIPAQYKAFTERLRASGINPVKTGTKTQLFAMTDSDVDKISGGREVKKAETVDLRGDLKPIEGGLHDPRIFGNGSRWGVITLTEPIPNPVFEQPLRRMLGLTEKQYRNILAGREDYGPFGTGPEAFSKKLKAMDLDKEIGAARNDIAGTRKGKRDIAVRKLGYLKSMKEQGFNPADLMLSKIPVLPPKYRPIAPLQGKGGVISDDANDLYLELMRANENFDSLRGELDDVGDERLAVYDAYRALTGLVAPASKELKDRKVKGLLKKIVGSSPKTGAVQRKLLSGNVDTVGRAVLLSDASLGMDEAGIPENIAFDIYEPYIVRGLVQRGFTRVAAMDAYKNKTDDARSVLLNELDRRPVVITRAPILHKGGEQGFKPKLIKGDSLKLPPTSFGPFGADSDGDTLNIYAVHSPKAVKDVLERMLPSKTLISPADFESPVFKPSQDHLLGLYQASKAKPSNKALRVFRNVQELKRALSRGDISINDPVKIME